MLFKSENDVIFLCPLLLLLISTVRRFCNSISVCLEIAKYRYYYWAKANIKWLPWCFRNWVCWKFWNFDVKSCQDIVLYIYTCESWTCGSSLVSVSQSNVKILMHFLFSYFFTNFMPFGLFPGKSFSGGYRKRSVVWNRLNAKKLLLVSF